MGTQTPFGYADKLDAFLVVDGKRHRIAETTSRGYFTLVVEADIPAGSLGEVVARELSDRAELSLGFIRIYKSAKGSRTIEYEVPATDAH